MPKTSYIDAPATSLASCIELQCGTLESMSVRVRKKSDCSVLDQSIDASELLDSSFITNTNGDIIDLVFMDDGDLNSVASLSFNSFDQAETITASMLEIQFTSRLKTR